MKTPTNELVGVAFFGRVLGDTGLVATSLPKTPEAWREAGFGTIFVAGGSPDRHLPIRRPVFTLDGWGNNGTREPAWGKATDLVQRVIDGIEGMIDPTPLSVKEGYGRVRVLSAFAITEPERDEDDPSSFARVGVDIEVHWVEVP